MHCWCCKYVCISFLLLTLQQATAQYTVRFVVIVPSDTGRVYLAGTFSGWNPASEKYLLQPAGRQQREIILYNVPSGKQEYKFTKGSWSLEEADAIGSSDTNRTITISHDTTVYCKVTAWIDNYFELNNLPARAKYYAMMGRSGYYLDKNLDSSYKYSKDLYKLSLELDSAEAEARALDLQGLVFTKLGNGQKALEMFFKGLEIKKKVKDSSGVSFTYHSIGDIYKTEKDTGKAIENYRLSAAWTEKKFEYYESIPLGEIGTILLNEGKIDSALYYAKKAIILGGASSGALLLMGNIYKKTGNENTAVNYYRQSIATELYSGFSSSTLAEAYSSLASALYNKALHDSAFYYARKAYRLALEIKNPFTIVNTSRLLIDLFRKEKMYDSALFYEDILLETNDSLYTQEKQKQIHNIYFNEQLKQADLQAQNEQYKSQIKIYVLAGILGLVVVAGLSYRSRLRSKFYKQLAEIEMRALRAQMNPHFIFNCLASINRYIVKSDTKTASGYLTKFSKLIRLILDNSSSEYINLDVEIQTLKLYLDMELLRFDHSFGYEIQQDEYIATENIMIPTMVIQPYIENAIWHGLLHKDEKGKLWVRFKKMNENMLQVEIKYDGIGRRKAQELGSKDTLKTRSYGMKISEDRIQIINTRYNIQSAVAVEDLIDGNGNAAGTKIIVHLPLIKQTVNPNISIA